MLWARAGAQLGEAQALTLAQENAINFAGFAFVMGLMLFVFLRDLGRFF